MTPQEKILLYNNEIDRMCDCPEKEKYKLEVKKLEKQQ